MLKLAPIALLFILMLSSCSSMKWLQGSWSGTGDQIDDKSWPVTLKVNDQDAFQIDYPSLLCSGEWVLVEKNSDQITFRENIEYGVDVCDQGVEVIVTKLNDDEMQVDYYLRKLYKDKPVATAKLKRVK